MSREEVHQLRIRDTYPAESMYPGATAFGSEDWFAQGSRATQILVMAEQLTRFSSSTDGSSEEDDRMEAGVSSQYAAEIDQLGIPKLAPSLHPEYAEFDRDSPISVERRLALWNEAFVNGNTEAATQLIRESVTDSAPVVRAAACVGVLAIDGSRLSREGLGQTPELAMLRILARGTASNTTQMAETIVQQLVPTSEAGSASRKRFGQKEQLTRADSASRRRNTPIVSIGIHGTFTYFSPGPLTPPHSFYQFLRRDIAGDLFNNSDEYFRWGSRYTLSSQLEGAQRLSDWANTYGGSGTLNVVFAHSHGGNVALTAAAEGLRISRLILLSTPANQRSTEEWNTIRGNVGRIASYRTHLDRVILVDQLASRWSWQRANRAVSDGLNFPPESGVFQPLPIGWLKHSNWLREDVWRHRGIDAAVRAEILHP